MTTIGFIGLGVMGGPMCRNVALKHDGDVIAFDLVPAAADNLKDTRGKFVSKMDDIWAKADVVLLSLPGGTQVEAVCNAALAQPRKPKIIIDLSTTTVASARKVAAALKAGGIEFADAPVARTREAAQQGKLSIMVGATPELFKQVEPWLRYMGTDVTHGGGTGTGQVLKLVNNALVFENVMAIAELMVIAERAGVKAETMIDAVSKGSGDSFALRNHATKSMAPRTYPEKSFPPEYVMKDLSYVLELAKDMNVPARAAELAMRYYQATADGGYSGKYFPAVREIIEKGGLS